MSRSIMDLSDRATVSKPLYALWERHLLLPYSKTYTHTCIWKAVIMFMIGIRLLLLKDFFSHGIMRQLRNHCGHIPTCWIPEKCNHVK